MTTILRPGIETIMRVFYENKDSKIHLRELARKTNLYGQSIVRYTKALEKDILQSEKDGNQKKYSTRKNKKVYAIYTIFDINKLEKLPEIRKNAIQTYLKNLPEQPVHAILFGSTAKENYTKDSDIDIFIITNKKIDTTEAEKETDNQTAIKISSFQITHKDFIKELKLKEDKVMQSAITTGYPIINHIRYYEELNNERT